MKITRDVVIDLWPVYVAGEASADTRALVDEFLAADPELARTLRSEAPLAATPPPPPDGETTALARTRDLVYGRSWLRGVRLLAVVFTVFAFGRIVSDTAFVVSPRRFIGQTVAAVVAWTVYLIGLWYYRARALRARP